MKKNFIQKINSRKTLFILLLFFIILIHISFILFLHSLFINKNNALKWKKPKTNRKLNDYYDKDYQEKQEERDKNGQNDKIVLISVFIFILYGLFLLISLYMGCKLKSLSKSNEVFFGVLKYIFMANNGYLVLSFIINVIIPTDVSLVLVGITGFFCFIGILIYLVKFCKVIFQNFFEQYFSWEIYKSWFRLPNDYVWKFIDLTDPCCHIDKYTIEPRPDGTIYNDTKFVDCWNKFIYIVKRIDIIIASIFFYIFLISLIVPWVIIKIIYKIVMAIINCCKNRPSKNVNTINNPEVNNINQNNIIPTVFTGNNGVNTIKKRKTRKGYKKNKSQIIQNNMILQDSKNHVENSNNMNRRKSLNLDKNISKFQNGTSRINQGNDIEIQDV